MFELLEVFDRTYRSLERRGPGPCGRLADHMPHADPPAEERPRLRRARRRGPQRWRGTVGRPAAVDLGRPS